MNMNEDIDNRFTKWSNRYQAYYKREPNSYYSFRAGVLSGKVIDACMPSEAALETTEGQKPSTNTGMAAEAAQICPYYYKDRLQTGEHNYEVLSCCRVAGKLRHA
jgi:hypothetical protein